MSMIIEQMPPEQQIRRRGSFLGYSLGIGENYSEVFKFETKNYVILDVIGPNNKTIYNVARYYGKISDLYKSFDEQDGFPR